MSDTVDILQITDKLTQGFRLEVTVWVIPSMVENAVAVRLPPFVNMISLTLCVVGCSDRIVHGPYVSPRHVAHDKSVTTVACNGFCGMDSGPRASRFRNPALHHWCCGVTIWNWFTTAPVRPFHMPWLTIWF